MRGASPARVVVALVAFAGLLSGCSRTADRDQAAICREAAVGLAGPVRLRITAQSALPATREEPSGVRLTIEPEDPDLRLSSLECRFTGSGSRPDLVALATPAGPIDETHLYFLNRFWLDDSAAVGSDPGLDDGRDARLPVLPFEAAFMIQNLLDAVPNAAIYGLLAAAYSIVYGLYGRINLAFGEISAVGGLAAVVGAAAFAQAPTGEVLGVVALLAIWASGQHGFVMERLVLWRLRKASGQQGSRGDDRHRSLFAGIPAAGHRVTTPLGRVPSRRTVSARPSGQLRGYRDPDGGSAGQHGRRGLRGASRDVSL